MADEWEPAPAAAQQLLAEAERIEAATATAHQRLDRLAWHGAEAVEARARAEQRRKRATLVAEQLRRMARESALFGSEGQP